MDTLAVLGTRMDVYRHAKASGNFRLLYAAKVSRLFRGITAAHIWWAYYMVREQKFSSFDRAFAHIDRLDIHEDDYGKSVLGLVYSDGKSERVSNSMWDDGFDRYEWVYTSTGRYWDRTYQQ